MDFGLAKTAIAVRDKAATLIAGSPFYMSPEQSSGRPVDARTDLYGLGITLFELASGRVPFFEGDIAHQHRTAMPPDLRDGLPAFPAALATLVAELLAKDPQDRPPSAEAVSERLIAYLDETAPTGPEADTAGSARAAAGDAAVTGSAASAAGAPGAVTGIASVLGTSPTA